MHEIIKKMSGNVLGVGLNQEMIDLINKNDKITECNLLNSYTRKEKKEKGIKGKTLNIKKIKKKFKKKKVDYIICDYEVIEKYLDTFVNDSIYINKNKLYFYNITYNDNLEKKYKRYNTVIKIKKNYLEIDNRNSKTNFFKNIYYRIIDFTSKMIEVIGDILMN